MADQNVKINIGTSFNGEGVAKTVQGLGKIGQVAKSASSTIGQLAGSFDGLDNSASKAIGSIGNLMSAFATGGAFGVAAMAVTSIVSAFAEMKKKAEEAAKVKFDNQIKGLEQISDRADKASESYKKLAKQVDDFKKSLLGLDMADTSQKKTDLEIEQEKKKLSGDKVGAAEKGIDIAKAEAEKAVAPAKEAAEAAARAYKTASREHDNQVKALQSLRESEERYQKKVDELVAKMGTQEWQNADDKEAAGFGKNKFRVELLRYQKLLAKAQEEISKAEDKELELKNAALTVWNNKLIADKEYTRSQSQAQLIILRAETELKKAKEEQLKAEQEKAKKAERESKEDKQKQLSSIRKQNELD